MVDLEKRERGHVLRFNNAKGTGSILSEEFHDEVWVHFSQIAVEGFQSLTDGQAVEFTRLVQPGPSGTRAVAFNVVPLAPT